MEFAGLLGFLVLFCVSKHTFCSSESNRLDCSMYQIKRIRILLGRKKGAYGQVLSADERQYEDQVEKKSGRTNEISLVIYQG